MSPRTCPFFGRIVCGPKAREFSAFIAAPHWCRTFTRVHVFARTFALSRIVLYCICATSLRYLILSQCFFVMPLCTVCFSCMPCVVVATHPQLSAYTCVACNASIALFCGGGLSHQAFAFVIVCLICIHKCHDVCASCCVTCISILYMCLMVYPIFCVTCSVTACCYGGNT